MIIRASRSNKFGERNAWLKMAEREAIEKAVVVREAGKS